MKNARLVSVDRVPTLTEVVDFGHNVALAHEPIEVQALQIVDQPAAAPDALSAEVLFELEQRIDSLFEPRLREA